mmetsp:Transcript_13055/g.30827  ORF Transcript_13055/g.30827 Transcript_13055/m.30827 type:complete len:312 (+) Transcript_13055:521-1456(+)
MSDEMARRCPRILMLARGRIASARRFASSFATADLTCIARAACDATVLSVGNLWNRIISSIADSTSPTAPSPCVPDNTSSFVARSSNSTSCMSTRREALAASNRFLSRLSSDTVTERDSFVSAPRALESSTKAWSSSRCFFPRRHFASARSLASLAAVISSAARSSSLSSVPAIFFSSAAAAAAAASLVSLSLSASAALPNATAAFFSAASIAAMASLAFAAATSLALTASAAVFSAASFSFIAVSVVSLREAIVLRRSSATAPPSDLTSSSVFVSAVSRVRPSATLSSSSTPLAKAAAVSSRDVLSSPSS